MTNANALYGYDCADQMANITTVSLTEVGDCNIEEPKLNITQKYVQLLQINDFTSAQVFKCSVKITRVITHCGMHSHISRVQDGELSYFKDMSYSECMLLQATGDIILAGTHITGITGNSTVNKPVTFAGEVDHNSGCSGSTYIDPYGKWNNVLVAGWVEISISDYYAEVHLETNKIRLRSGVSCKLASTTCIDADGSRVFWSPLPEDSCNKNKYSILYQGQIDRIEDTNEGKVMYTLESQDITFALWKKGEQSVCGYKLARTEHPKLLVFEDAKESLFVKKDPIATANLDIFAYVNSKFLYVEKYIRGQLNRLYYDVLKSKCELERKVIINALSIATINPAEFGYRIMEERGYLGVVTGEVIHLLKCLQVEVVPRPTKECYDQLPVLRGNDEFFLAPRTRILLRTGTQIHCDKRLPPMYQLNGHWLRFLPDAISADPPEILKPQTKPTWKYNSPETLAIGGIYSEKDTSRLRDMILFPMEKPSVLNKIALGMSGRTINRQGMSLMGFFDEDLLEEIAENTWRKIWSNFLAFGSASAGFIGIILICRLIKLLIDTVVHGYAIYSLYGFSVHLIGSVWNSITQLLIHLGQDRKYRRNIEDKNDEDVEENRQDEVEPTAPSSQEMETKKLEVRNRIYPDLRDEASI